VREGLRLRVGRPNELMEALSERRRQNGLPPPLCRLLLCARAFKTSWIVDCRSQTGGARRDGAEASMCSIHRKGIRHGVQARTPCPRPRPAMTLTVARKLKVPLPFPFAQHTPTRHLIRTRGA
jgi:hypothetical protein